MRKLVLVIFILASNTIFAQTPSVTTQQPLVVTPYIYKAGSDTTYTYDAKVTFVGQVNPNGEECSSYFEYGPTTSYGNTVAASPAIAAGTDDITLAVTTVIHNCGGDYHVRLCVVSGGVTYYGSDILFAPEVDPTIKLVYTANPSDDPITTSFSITNQNYFPVSLTCTDGTNTDTLKIAPSATGDFTCNKHSMVSFYYNYTNPDGSIVYPFLFMQMPTNDQTTADIPSAQSNITISPYGYAANKDSIWYNIANANDADVSLIVIVGDFQWTTIIGKNRNKNIELPYGDATFYFNNINISEFYKPLVKTTFGYFWFLYGSTLNYDFGDLSSTSSFCYAYPQKVYLDASDNSFTSKIITSNMTASVTPSQSWINGGSYGNTLYPFNGPLSMSISTNTTGKTRTGTVGVTVFHYVIVNNNPLTLSSSLLTCYVTVVQSALTVPKEHLKLRLRADEGITASASGDSVSVWNDMSGNGNNATQSNSANRPVVIGGAINNMSALRFNGSGSHLVLPTSAALGIQNHDYEMFVVARSSSSNIQFLLSGNSIEQFEYHLNGVGARFIPITATYLDEGTSGAYADGNPHVFEAHASSTGGGMSVDGVNGGTTTANILSSDGGLLRLGVRSDGTYHFNGDIAEVLVYDTVLTSVQRDSVEQYLAARYNINSGTLPTVSTLTTSGNWTTASNWDNGLPGTTTAATIAANCTLDNNETVKNITVTPSKALTIPSGKTLTVNGDMTLQSDSTGTASIINNGAVSVSGVTKAQLYLSANHWHVVSPIVTGEAINTFIQDTTNHIPQKTVNGVVNYGMMGYNETANQWNSYYTAASTGMLQAGQGYCVRRASNGTVTFSGTLNKGTQTVPLTKNGDGWNCVGNPYPAPIDMNTTAAADSNFLAENISAFDPNYACLYVWDDASGQYRIVSNIPTTRDLGENIFLPGQGFFVKAASGNVSLQFTPSLLQPQIGSALKVVASSSPTQSLTPAKVNQSVTNATMDFSWPDFELNATNGTTSASTLIAFNDKMTKGLDPTYDAGLLRGTTGLSLYSHLVDDDSVDFAIQCLPEDYDHLVIPIGIDTQTGGTFTFTATTMNLPSTCSVILEDKATDTFTSLENGASYQTTLAPGTSGIGRFYIHTSSITTGLSALTAGTFSLKAYPSKGEIIIEGEVDSHAQACLYDINGRELGFYKLNEGDINRLPAAGLSPGVYVLSVIEPAHHANIKIIIL